MLLERRIRMMAMGVIVIGSGAACAQAISTNKQTVQTYMDAFNRSDHAAILDCLTEDVVWDLPGGFHLIGKAAFDKEIENPAFVGRPTIVVTRLTEENHVVVAEGTVRSARKYGPPLNAVFVDVFEMRHGKVKKLTSYLMEIKKDQPKVSTPPAVKTLKFKSETTHGQILLPGQKPPVSTLEQSEKALQPSTATVSPN